MRIADDFLDSAGLPLPGTGDDSFLGVQLLAEPTLLDWYRSERENLVMDTARRISRINGRKSSTTYFVQSTDANKPVLISRGIGQYTAMSMDGSNDHLAIAGPEPLDFTQAWTVVSIFKPQSFAATMYPWGDFSSTSARSLLSISPSGMASANNGGGITPNLQLVLSQWHVSIVAFDGQTIFHRLNGVEVSSAVASGSGGIGTFCWGSLSTGSGYFNGDLSDLICFQGCVFDDPTLIRNIEDYASSVYPIVLA